MPHRIVHESKNNLHSKTAIKRESGMDFPPRDYAYVPDPLRPATWRLRLTESPGVISLDQVQRAAAAISPTGYRGNRLEIPQAAASSVKRRLLAEFRRLKVGENKIPATVKSAADDGDFMVWKGTDNRIRWFSVYSNNFRDEDNPPEILSEKSHQTFVELVDEGLVDYPELWLWHIPGTAWGKADWVAYSDGFAMAAGYVYPGFESVADGIARYSKDNPLLVSHGMPKPMLVYDPRYERVMLFHVTVEISPLPAFAAANKMTGFAILGKGDVTMALPKEKKDFLQATGLSPAVIAQVEKNLGRARQTAEDAGMESKARSDDDEPEDEDIDEEDADEGELDEEDGDEGESEDADGEDSVKERGTQEKRVNWNSDKKPKKPSQKRVNWNSDKKPDEKRVNWNSDDESDEKRVNWNSDKKPDEKRVNWNSDKKPRRSKKKEAAVEEVYATREEVAQAVADVINPIVASINAMAATMERMTKEINRLGAEDEERLAAVKEVTPGLSLTDMIMRQSPIGKTKARVSERSNLKEEGPVETEAPDPFAGSTMVPLINQLQKQAYNGSQRS